MNPVSQISGGELSQNMWVVSLMNTGSALTGHAVIVAEGIQENGDLFWGQYEVYGKIIVDQRVADVVQRTTGNAQGYIAQINVRESTGPYTRDCTSFSRKSWTVDPENVQRMIESIKNAQTLTEQANANNEEPPFKYQTAGSGRFSWLGGNGGNNCTTWAEEQLAQAGIGNGSILADLIKAMPELHADGCVVS